MSIEYLQQLASDGTFPVDVTDDTLRILKAAGMVEVQLPDGDRSHACVHAITGKGRAAMLAEIANQVIARRSADVESALRIRV
ncbi:hypothetical protein B2J88_21865 [Rhodococcus sp. SRB_17]|nr:hypothetical protein [Rhodococcus sp. SRB_17]